MSVSSFCFYAFLLDHVVSSKFANSFKPPNSNLKWESVVVSNIKELGQKEIVEKFGPRVAPWGYDIVVDKKSTIMREVEYLICYSNDWVAVGILNNKKDYNNEIVSLKLFFNIVFSRSLFNSEAAIFNATTFTLVVLL